MEPENQLGGAHDELEWNDAAHLCSSGREQIFVVVVVCP